MADIAEMLYNYNPQGYYEQNRLRSLMADSELIKQATEQAKLNRQQKIWGLQDALAGGDESARGQLAIYDPEGTAKTAQISRAAWQDAGRFARAYNNAPDDMKAAIAQQMVGYMGKTYGNSLISDIPPISDTANFGNFMSGLAQAVDNMDISGGDIYKAQEDEKARQQAFDYDMRKMYAKEAMQERAVQRAFNQREQMIQKAEDDGDITPEQARMARLEIMGIKSNFGGDPKGEADLRKEFNNLTKDYRSVGDAYSRIKSVKPTAAGDLSLIFNYMKMLDPDSTVREGEFANAERAKAWFDEAGAPTAVRLAYEKAKKGTRLLPEQRADFINTARELMSAQKLSFDNYAERYKKIADSSGYDSRRIIIDPYESLMQEQETKNQPMVQIKAPDGEVYNVPENQVEKALSQGGKRV